MKISGKEIIKNVEDRPTEQAIKNWDWKQLHDELMNKYSEIDENGFYRFNYGRWDLVKPDGEKRAARKPAESKSVVKPAIEIVANDGSGITIPIKLILSIEVQAKG